MKRAIWGYNEHTFVHIADRLSRTRQQRPLADYPTALTHVPDQNPTQMARPSKMHARTARRHSPDSPTLPPRLLLAA
jgi:hypothetical protein